jgi:hypothetical protein
MCRSGQLSGCNIVCVYCTHRLLQGTRDPLTPPQRPAGRAPVRQIHVLRPDGRRGCAGEVPGMLQHAAARRPELRQVGVERVRRVQCRQRVACARARGPWTQGKRPASCEGEVRPRASALA